MNLSRFLVRRLSDTEKVGERDSGGVKLLIGVGHAVRDQIVLQLTATSFFLSAGKTMGQRQLRSMVGRDIFAIASAVII